MLLLPLVVVRAAGRFGTPFRGISGDWNEVRRIIGSGLELNPTKTSLDFNHIDMVEQAAAHSSKQMTAYLYGMLVSLEVKGVERLRNRQ
jgi:hypothetical protein